MPKFKINILTPLLSEYWKGKQIYDNDGVAKTVQEISCNTSNWSVFILFTDGTKYKGHIDDVHEAELITDINVKGNHERLKNKNK